MLSSPRTSYVPNILPQNEAILPQNQPTGGKPAKKSQQPSFLGGLLPDQSAGSTGKTLLGQ